jgi:hypothetical protein
MIYRIESHKTKIQDDMLIPKYNINLFYQFFIHQDKKRYDEIKFCLKKNVNNVNISKIYLLNEKIYTKEELDIESDKIVQININKRLLYSDVFEHINNNNITGYNIIINADIFLDDTISILHRTDIDTEKNIFALLRYEYNKDGNSKLLGPCADSQDTWIFHSNFIKDIIKYNKLFKFTLGKLGCDNKIAYLFNILGFNIINDPKLIKTYHYHSTQIRNYSLTERLHFPYCYIYPLDIELDSKERTRRLDNLSFYDNNELYSYIKNKFDTNKNFIIPRIAGVENNYAVQALIYNLNKDDNQKKVILDSLNGKIKDVMKNNAGINITNNTSIFRYSMMYLKAFENCEIYFGWEKNGNVYKYISKSQDFIENNYTLLNQKMIWAFSLDIFHYIYHNPWTYALAGKKILLISPFEESLNEKIPIREKIYGIDLFPNCTFITLKSLQTQGTEESDDFFVEINKFFKKLDEIKNDYDIALVSAGGYGNLICNHIYEQGKSAIYVGGVLQMYFGILGNRWLKERPDIINMYLNKYWTRPKETEKPKNHSSIEGSCYW